MDNDLSSARESVLDGLRLPSEEELLRGMPFFRESVEADIREFATRLGCGARKRDLAWPAPVLECLDELTVSPDAQGVMHLRELHDTLRNSGSFLAETCRMRCDIYLAHLGIPEAAFRLSAEMASLALEDISNGARPETIYLSLGWAAAACRFEKLSGVGQDESSPFRHYLRDEAIRFGNRFEHAIIAAGRVHDHDSEAKRQESFPEGGGPSPDDGNAGNEPSAEDGIVVFRSIGNDVTAEGKRVGKEFASLLNWPLSLKKVPDLRQVRAALVDEFPYAADLIDAVLNGLAGRRHVWIHPMILLGPPGCGKSRFARRLAEELQTPCMLIPCGGMADSAIGGASRRWSTGEPSLPVAAIRQHGCAGPLIILDEIEKVGTDRNNGNAHDVLLGLLEPETARRWHDPYIEADCDLSAVTWLMTANSVAPIPTVLRDRCRILRFPEPGPEQLTVLAPRILQSLYAETGHHPRWATPLEAFEVEALVTAWGGGSIRKLKRLVEGLIRARERERSRQ